MCCIFQILSPITRDWKHPPLAHKIHDLLILNPLFLELMTELGKRMSQSTQQCLFTCSDLPPKFTEGNTLKKYCPDFTLKHWPKI